MIPKDPAILLSFINTKLRDFYPSLDELCDDLQVEKDEIESILMKINYKYSEKRNQFVWHKTRIM